jgi:hypothetical protein
MSEGQTCPRHRIACSCLVTTRHEDDALDELIAAQWDSEADRKAVRRKLAMCGIRSVTVLGKCITTPVWGIDLDPF